MSNDLPDNILQESDVEGPYKAKIGTYTPKLIWVHENDTPLEEGDRFRFVKTNPADKHDEWGSDQKAGIVDEVRNERIESIYFITERTYYDGFLNKNE